MTAYYFVEPLDTLSVRGNRSFGGAGEHGFSVMPPWPSLFAGAFRSAILGDDATRLARFVAIASDRNLDQAARQTATREALGDTLFATLGTPATPGSFRVAWLSLAMLSSPASGGGVGGEGIQPVIPLPADLAAFDDADTPPLVALHPAAAITGELPLTPLLRVRKQVKPASGRWLAGDGHAAYLRGKLPATTQGTDALFARETRLGIALDPDARTAEDGALYTTETVSFRPGAGFLVGIAGADGVLPESGLLRLGGDGRGARYRRLPEFIPPPAAQPEVGGGFRLILATPGVFKDGWLPDGVQREGHDYRLTGEGFSARLVAAAVSRHDVISGWDLAHWKPKTAQRVASAGSVYWFADFEGDAGKLAAWVAGGLWGENADPSRRAEGFNLAWLAAWPQGDHHAA
jgi:CRISPR-associated protein Cmr3